MHNKFTNLGLLITIISFNLKLRFIINNHRFVVFNPWVFSYDILNPRFLPKSWNQGLKKKPRIENYKPVIVDYKPKFQIETYDCNLQT